MDPRILGLDAQLLADAFWTALNVFILFLVASYLGVDMVRDFVKKRQDKIRGELEFAATEKQDAIALKEEYDAKLKAIDAERDEILGEARKRAKLQEDTIVSAAREEAGRITERANTQIELEKKKALEEVKQEMITIASLMAAKVVGGNMDTTIQDSMVEETLKEIGESTWQS